MNWRTDGVLAEGALVFDVLEAVAADGPETAPDPAAGEKEDGEPDPAAGTDLLLSPGPALVLAVVALEEQRVLRRVDHPTRRHRLLPRLIAHHDHLLSPS